MRDQANIAKPPYFAQTGWWFQKKASFDPPPRRFAPPLLSRRGDQVIRTIAILIALACSLPTTAFAEQKVFERESLRIIIDSDWATQGAPGYLPVRLDITNLGEAREIEISASGQRFFGGAYRRTARGGVYSPGYGTGNADIRQTIRLRRGDNKKLTMPLPVFGDNENFQVRLRENGQLYPFSSNVSFQSGRSILESPVLLVADPTTPMGPMASGWRRPALAPGYSYSGVAPPGALLDFTLEPERLPENWLGYTSLRAVLLGPTEWKRLNPAQQDALLTWTASGGDLLLLDAAPESGLPISQDDYLSNSDHVVRAYFFGHVHAIKSAHIIKEGFVKIVDDLSRMITLQDWALPANRAKDWGFIQERGFRLPIADAGVVSSRAYLSILVLFVAVIGPVNYIYLWRKRQQVLMVFTVPIVSACFILMLAAYGVLSQGLDVRGRAVTFTMLDQSLKQAATRSSVSLYPGGITPGEGLRFPSDIAVFPLGVDGTGIRNQMNVNLTDDQRFTVGLLKPRSPSNFEQIGFRAARERLNFERTGDRVRVTNGLGSTIHRLLYRDGGKTYALADELAAGEKATMDVQVQAFKNNEVFGNDLKDTPVVWKFPEIVEHQRDGTYLAVLETSPFWHPGISKLQEHRSVHVVLGYGLQP